MHEEHRREQHDEHDRDSDGREDEGVADRLEQVAVVARVRRVEEGGPVIEGVTASRTTRNVNSIIETIGMAKTRPTMTRMIQRAVLLGSVPMRVALLISATAMRGSAEPSSRS